MLVFIYPINAVQIAVDIHVGEQNARPTMSVISSHCSIGDLSIKEHGGPRYHGLIFFNSYSCTSSPMPLLNPNTIYSWLYNFFLKVLHKMIKKAAEKAVGSSIENLLNHVRAPHLAVDHHHHQPPHGSHHNRAATRPCKRSPWPSASATSPKWTTRWWARRRSATTT